MTPNNTLPWFSRLISTYHSVDPVPSGRVPVSEVLATIKDGRNGLKESIQAVRDLWAKAGKAAADKRKKALPGATFGGLFTYRDSEHITETTGLCVLDLDDVPGMIETRKRMLFEDKHVLAAWVSPRGNGIKLLVEFDATDRESHDRCWAMARNHFDRTEGLRLDSAAADIYRLTYLCYDPDILIRSDSFVAEPFCAMSEELFADQPILITGVEGERKAKLKEYHKKSLSSMDSDFLAIDDLGWNGTTCPTLAKIDGNLPARAASMVQMKVSANKIKLVTMPDGRRLVGPGNRDHLVNAWAFSVGELGLGGTLAAEAVRAFVTDCIHQPADNEYSAEETERQAGRASKVARTYERQVARAEGKLAPAVVNDNSRVKVYEDKKSAVDTTEMSAPQRARHVINDHLSTKDGRPTMLRWREDDYEYDEVGGWNRLHHETLPHYMAKLLGNLPDVSQSHIDSTVKSIRQHLVRSDINVVPCRLSTKQPVPRLCQFRNGCIDFGVINGGTPEGFLPELLPKDPDLFTTYQIPHDFDPTASCPTFLDFLTTQFSGDLDRVALMQEWFGYHLIPDNSLQKLAVFCGPTRSGKGTTVNVLHSMLGHGRCSTVMADDLQSDFAMEPWIGTLSVLIDDVNDGGSRYGVAMVVDKLKSIVGSRSLTINRKNQKKVDSSVTWRFTMTTNDLPRMRDDSGALAKRMVVIPYDKSHAGHEDWMLTSKLEMEMSGIIAWAVAGLVRLLRSGRFTESESSKQQVEQLRLDSTPILRFTREVFFVSPGEDYIPNDEVFAVYERWCKENGEHVKPKNSLFKALRTQPDLSSVQFTQINLNTGEAHWRPRIMRGLRWSAEGQRLRSEMGSYPSAGAKVS